MRRHPNMQSYRDPWTWLDTFYSGLLASLMIGFIFIFTVTILLVKVP